MGNDQDWSIDNIIKKESLRNKTILERVAQQKGLSATTFHRAKFIKKYASELFDEQLHLPNAKLTPIYHKLKLEVESFQFRCIELEIEKGAENVTEQDLKEIASEYENLTFPFGN